LLHHGKALILLDGLDEVQEKTAVLKQVCKLSEVLQNQLIITCRIATQHYQLEGFTDIEIVDFEAQMKPLPKVVCRRWQKIPEKD